MKKIDFSGVYIGSLGGIDLHVGMVIESKTGIDDDGDYYEEYLIVYNESSLAFMAQFNDNVLVAIDDLDARIRIKPQSESTN